MGATCDNMDISNYSKAEYREEDIAIIGIYAKLPLAQDVNEFWENIKNGRDCITGFPATRKKDVDAYIRFINNGRREAEYNVGGYLEEIDKFDYDLFRISPKEASLMDPNHRIFLEAAWGAIEDAGYGGGNLEGSKTGVYVAFRNVSGRDYSKLILTVEPSSIPLAIPGNTNSIIPSRISYMLDLKGPTAIIDTACSSSLVTLHLACQGIKTGDCELAIAGGVEINLLPYKESISTMVGIESEDKRTKTFDEDAGGTCESEGVAAILLKPINKAILDGDNIYAVIKGSAINQDGRSVGITAPNAAAQEEALVSAWERAGINPETLSYIEAHGTATKIGDPTEILGIKKAFRRYTQRNQFCAIGSVKSNIGHLGAVAGFSGILKSVMALKHKKIPPTINFRNPNRRISFHKSPVYINDVLTDWDSGDFPRRCGVSSFGFSGTNCHFVLEEAPIKNTISKKKERNALLQVFTLSGKTENVVRDLIYKYSTFLLESNSQRDICYTANTGRGHYNIRLAFIVKEGEDISEKIRSLKGLSFETGINTDYFFGKHIIQKGGSKANLLHSITEKEKKELTRESDLKIDGFISSGQTDLDLLRQICMLYIKGADVKWDKLYAGEKRIKASLPAYAFDKKRCWIDVPEVAYQYDLPETCNGKLFYISKWKKKSIKNQFDSTKKECILLLNGVSGKGREVSKRLRDQGDEVIEMYHSNSQHTSSGEKAFTIKECSSDYDRLIKKLANKDITKIVHMGTLGSDEVEDIKQLEETLNNGVYSLFYLIKAVNNNLNRNMDIVLIADYVNYICKTEQRIKPQNATLFGLGKVIGFENPKLKCRCVDIDNTTSVNDLLFEIKSEYRNYMTAYRDGCRYIEEINEADIDTFDDNEIKINENGVYIITGGMGGIGLQVCKYLASKNRVNLILINRSHVPQNIEWKSYIDEGPDRNLRIKLQQLTDIENTGASVTCYSADVTDPDETQAVLESVRREFGKIDGIFNTVGVSKGSMIKVQEVNEFSETLASKIYGTWLLDYLTREDNLEFMLLFSSAITVIGGTGGGAYTAANSYLDSFAAYRSMNGNRTITIDWPTWEGIGFSENTSVDETRELFKVIKPDSAIKALEKVMEKDIQRVIIGQMNYDSPVLSLIDYLPFTMSEQILSKVKKDEVVPQNENLDKKPKKEVVLEGRESDSYSDLESLIAQIWSKILGFEKFNIHDDFFEIGGDSISVVQLEVEMQKNNLPVTVDEITRYSILKELASFIETKTVCSSKKYKVLENINPFCDIFYKSCFYNSFFPVVKRLGKMIEPFLINDVPVFDYDENMDDVKLRIKYIENERLEKLCDDLGIGFDIRGSSNNIIDDIVSAIEKDRPVIIWVDCFFESIREDTYQKEHLPHTWLVYGFNSEEKIFNIIEHSFSQNLLYKERIISFEDTENSYKGYLTNYEYGEDLPTYFEFYPSVYNKNSYKADDVIRVMTQNIYSVREQIISGLENILRFYDDFVYIVSDEQILRKNISNLISLFNDILNAKKAEKFKNLRIIKEPQNIKFLLDNVYDSWSSLRLELTRYMFSPNYDISALQVLADRIKEIYKWENEYYAKLI